MAFEYRGVHYTDEQQTLMTKRCPRCKQDKSLDDFPQYKPGARRGLPFGSYCMACCVEITRERRAKAKGDKQS